MALVMLPSDLPWWDSVKKHLKKVTEAGNASQLIECMQRIHELCNVSLDPDEDTTDPQQFIGLMNFLDNDLTVEERNNVLNKTFPNIAKRALSIKSLRPKGGLHFSLQQQCDCNELDYVFVSALVANAFFSTFPKRTDKSHPTLQNFNFSDFFKHLNTNAQKSKLRSILHYFDWLEINGNATGSLKISRQVMSSKEWLTIEDWLECSLPLCPVHIRHEGKLERAEIDSLQVCFASAKIGGNVLGDGTTQECMNLVTFPEMLTILLNVESLEDNEVLTLERARPISRIADPKNRAILEKLGDENKVSICCIDADDYTKLPIGQYEEDNVLRELNKCLLAFQQKQTSNSDGSTGPTMNHPRHRRLSPIGESMGSNKSDAPNIPLITQQSASTNRSGSQSPVGDNNNFSTNKLKVQLEAERNLHKKGSSGSGEAEALVHNRRGRFIVLGSSGECLPVTRHPLERARSIYSSCESSEEEFHSAKTSLDDGSEDENYHKRYSIDLETAETRQTFAKKLKDVLWRESSETSPTSSESSYAVGISITGSQVRDNNIKVRRGGSTGFALHEDSMDETFLNNSLQQEKQWIDKFRTKQSGMSRKESSKSSEYSFSTEYSSELEEVYEQFAKWLQDPVLETDKGTKKELDARELAVVQFAGSLLKRTLSDTFAGVPVPLTEGCDAPAADAEIFTSNKKHKLVLNTKSLSLELARHKHKLAAQLTGCDDDGKCSSPLEKNGDDLGVTETVVKHEDQKLRKNNPKLRFIHYVTAIIQTLEDDAVNVQIPQDEQLSQISQRPKGPLKAVSTGNWGCGSSRKGDVQLKVIVQWLAASVAGVPALIYYTCGHQQLTKLDTVCRILVDRKWTVKDLTQAALRYSNHVLHGRQLSGTLFEELIGVERTV